MSGEEVRGFGSWAKERENDFGQAVGVPQLYKERVRLGHFALRVSTM
jgi:hypothetical protein